MRGILLFLFWFIYLPLLRLLSLLLFWNSKIIERNRFEKKNKFEARAQSFRDYGIEADMCFEFSSEGEYQQVAPLIEDCLRAGQNIELVFFSPSVEKAIMKLAWDYRNQVRYLRYPVLRLFPFIERRSFTHWVTAKTLIMVRYDLFPEFLLWGMKKDHNLRMVWMSFKKERSKGKFPSFWKKLFLKNASAIVYAGEPDLKQGRELGLDGKAFDFRIEQIRRRTELREEKFKKVFPVYPDFRAHVDSFGTGQKIILGNAWPSDLFLLRDIPKDTLVVIVPHQLSDEMLSLFWEGLDGLGREVLEINDSTTSFKPSNTILINKKGILCELYADFPHAYVGGGFEGSIHSVLEPLVSGSLNLSCGPFHHRSTEYDIAQDAGRMSEVNTPEQFLAWLNDHGKNAEHDRINRLVKDYESLREFVASC